MKIESIDVDAAIHQVQQLLDTERHLSPALKSAMELILLLVSVLLNRVTLNSHNSSKSPASDPNRKKTTRQPSDKASGGQPSHPGKTLQKIDDPDDIKVIRMARKTTFVAASSLGKSFRVLTDLRITLFNDSIALVV